MAVSPLDLAKQLLSVLDRDRVRLLRIDNYLHGLHDDPYMPQNADDEYRLLARRCVSNWMPLLVGTPAQAMYVDGFRKGTDSEPVKVNSLDLSPEMKHWQRSRLDARQSPVHRGALTYGHSFALTEKMRTGLAATKGLSALRTSALYEDPANDDIPYAALTVTAWPVSSDDKSRGTARMWDATYEYTVKFGAISDDTAVSVTRVKRHGASECPVTRFAAAVDLEGRTVGVIEPMIALQNRINQTVFDLLVSQTYASFKVRYATGMAPPIERDDNGDPVFDHSGNPKPLPINHNARRFLFAEDPDVKFGSLDETPLNGFIESIDMSIRHLAAVSQTPPHHLLGQIANLSAEALTAAEVSLSRKIEEFRHSFGESWERVFRIAAELEGIVSSAEDYSGEVLWRDMEQRSLAQAADALLKLSDLGIPQRGLWRRVPNVTQNELRDWEEMQEDEPIAQLSDALVRSSAGSRTAIPPSDDF